MPHFISKRFNRLAMIAVVCGLTIAIGQMPIVSEAASNLMTAPEALTPPDLSQLPALLAEAQQNGTARVIVSFRLSAPLKVGNKADMQGQQSFIQQARSSLVNVLAGHNVTIKAGRDWVFPAIALSADSATLQQIAQSSLISGISADHLSKITDTAGDSLIGIPTSWNSGYTGQGQSIAILDTGVQSNHPFLGNRVLAEACFSTNSNGYTSLCPNNLPSQTGVGAAAPCSLNGCDHGTHVAGIAAGNGLNIGGVGYAGAAINANILAVQIFTNSQNSPSAFDSDIISGLNWVYSQRSSFNIAAVNLSLGNGIIYNNTARCDAVDSSLKGAIDALRSVNIATVIAAGNDGSSKGISYPGCISSAISVGVVDNKDSIQTSFSNSGLSTTNVSMPTLLAPGLNVLSSLPGSTYGALSGTSMAAPYVAGAIAVLKSQKPAATVDQLLNVLKNTGRLLTDSNSSATIARIQVNAAEAVFATPPRHKTIGVFRSDSNIFYLRNSNTTGVGDVTVPFGYGTTNYPVVGDWTGTGVDRVGLYDQSKGLFILCTAPDNLTCAYTNAKYLTQFTLGLAGDQPIVGRWGVRDTYVDTGSGPTITKPTANDGVGVFRPSNGLIYLKNTLTTGYADYTMVLGIPGDVGIVGDWIGDGVSSPGVYRPSNSVYYLSNSVCNCSVVGDLEISYGVQYDSPVVGNWLGSPSAQGIGIGLYRRSDGFFYLRNTPTTGFADNSFYYGLAHDIPVSGRWSSTQPTSLSGASNVTSVSPGSILVPSSGGSSGALPTPGTSGSSGG